MKRKNESKESVSKRPFKAPTTEEVQELRHNVQQFKSNLFKLKVDELLKEVRLPSKTKATAEHALKELKGMIETLPETCAYSLLEHAAHFKNIVVPWPEKIPTQESNVHFKITKPAKIYVVGSFLLGTLAKSPNGYTIDLGVELPLEMLHEKDHKGYRYLWKRAIYLSCIAQHLSKYNLCFDSFNGDANRPVLNCKIAQDLVIRIIPLLPVDYAFVRKLTPTHSNMNPGSDLTPTPIYNSSILMDSLLVSMLKFIHGHSQGSEEFKDAIVLGKVWLNLRGFDHIISPFGGFQFTMLLMYLIQHGSKHDLNLSYQLSSYQLFKVVIEFLAKHDFSQPLSFVDNTHGFSGAFDLVLVDPSGKMNLFWDLKRSDMDLIQHEARLTNDLLNDSKEDHFDLLFLKNACSDNIRFDHHFTLKVPNNQVGLEVPAFIKKHLANRVSLVTSVKPTSTKTEWPLDQSAPHQEMIILGINGNGNESLALVEYGPSADDPEASKLFKNVWGNKTETRRFKDGSIKESVVWTDKSYFQDRMLILPEMIQYIIEHHYGSIIEQSPVSYLHQLKKLFDKSLSVNTKMVKEQFDDLQKAIRSIDLPLVVSNISLQTPIFTMTSYTVPLDFSIEFESSNRWPDEFEAVQEMKLAFYVKLCDALNEKYEETLEAQVVCPALITDRLSEQYLEITQKNVVYRCRIFCEKDQAAVEGLTDKRKKVCGSTLKEFTQIRPALVRGISRICLENPYLVHTIRLVKEWCAQHLLLCHIPEMIIDLLCLHVYQRANVHVSAQSLVTGFHRVMDFIADLNWKNEPIFVNITDNSDAIHNCMDLFSLNRAQADTPYGRALFVGTGVDPGCDLWSNESNNELIVSRLCALANATRQRLQQPTVSFKSLLSTPWSHYDALIHLRDLIANETQMSSKYKNLEAPAAFPVPGRYLMDQYIQEIKTVLQYGAVIFYNVRSPTRIGLIWKPESKLNLKKFASSAHVSLIPTENGLVMNKKALLAELYNLGQGLVEKIENKK